MNMKTGLTTSDWAKGLFVFLFLSAVLVLMGCDNRGPAEKTGQKIDQTAEKAGNKIDNATDSLREPAQNR